MNRLLDATSEKISLPLGEYLSGIDFGSSRFFFPDFYGDTPCLKSLPGRNIIINPKRLYTRGKLYTTQSWVSVEKIRHVISNEASGVIDGNDGIPKVWLIGDLGSNDYRHVKVVVGDGNHRITNCLLCEHPAIVHVNAILPEDKEVIGFSVLRRRMLEVLAQSSYSGFSPEACQAQEISFDKEITEEDEAKFNELNTKGILYPIGLSLKTGQNTPSISDITGKTIIFNPNVMKNRGTLYTTQSFVDDGKMAIAPIRNSGGSVLKVWLYDHRKSGGKIERRLIVGDGNHRLSDFLISGGNLMKAVIIGEYQKFSPIFHFSTFLNYYKDRKGQTW